MYLDVFLLPRVPVSLLARGGGGGSEPTICPTLATYTVAGGAAEIDRRAFRTLHLSMPRYSSTITPFSGET